MTAAQSAGTLPAVGSQAPEFTLRSTANLDVSLSSYRNKSNVLLAFFPLAFSGTCSLELKAFSDDLAQFRTRNTEVVPISDDSVDSLREFKAKLNMPFDLLSDFKRVVSRQYGVLNDEKFYANRAYVLIDKSGVVRWVWQEKVNGERRENEELLRHIAELDTAGAR